MLFNLLSNFLRALGDSRTPLYFLVLACVLNIALDLEMCIRDRHTFGTHATFPFFPKQ